MKEARFKACAKLGAGVLIAKTGRLAGAGIARSGEQFAGRIGGMFHHQPVEHSAVAASLPGHDELDREPAVWRAHTHPARLSLARCRHGRALGSVFLSGDGEELPPHHGLERSLATGSHLRKKRWSSSCGSAGGRVK